MTSTLDRVRTEIETARETAARDIRIQLDSVDGGLTEVLGGEETRDSHPHADRLAELGATLDGLEEEEAEGETRTHIVEARGALREYIKEREPD